MEERGASRDFQQDRADASPQHAYRVTFVHRGDWAGFEVVVTAPDPEAAEEAAALILAQRAGRTAAITEWQHAETLDVSGAEYA